MRRLGVLLLGSVLVACATGGGDLREGARSACLAQEIPEAEMDDCMDRMEATLRAARDHRRDAPQTPPNEQ